MTKPNCTMDLVAWTASTWLVPQDVWNVSCLGGWTAGNLLGTSRDLARFGFELYRPGGSVVSAARQGEMTDWGSTGGFAFYGMGTFNLDWTTGSEAAYGHVGDTYGYQSAVTYLPDLNAALAVGTNAETSPQAQPADATCRAYQAIKAWKQGTKAPTCQFESRGHFFGSCKCD